MTQGLAQKNYSMKSGAEKDEWKTLLANETQSCNKEGKRSWCLKEEEKLWVRGCDRQWRLKNVWLSWKWLSRNGINQSNFKLENSLIFPFNNRCSRSFENC